MSKDDNCKNSRAGNGTKLKTESLLEYELPKLTGNSKNATKKAYRIRNVYQSMNPDSELLERETLSTYWLDNRKNLIGDVLLSKKIYPKLIGENADKLRWAYAIRSGFSDSFSESRLLHSQKEASFWLENRRLFDFAIFGFKTANDDSD